MIFVTKIDGKKFVVNAELIEIIEETPETMITTVTGKKILVKEKISEVVEKVKEYKKEITKPLIKTKENFNQGVTQ